MYFIMLWFHSDSGTELFIFVNFPSHLDPQFKSFLIIFKSFKNHLDSVIKNFECLGVAELQQGAARSLKPHH